MNVPELHHTEECSQPTVKSLRIYGLTPDAEPRASDGDIDNTPMTQVKLLGDMDSATTHRLLKSVFGEDYPCFMDNAISHSQTPKTDLRILFRIKFFLQIALHFLDW